MLNWSSYFFVYTCKTKNPKTLQMNELGFYCEVPSVPDKQVL